MLTYDWTKNGEQVTASKKAKKKTPVLPVGAGMHQTRKTGHYKGKFQVRGEDGGLKAAAMNTEQTASAKDVPTVGLTRWCSRPNMRRNDRPQLTPFASELSAEQT